MTNHAVADEVRAEMARQRKTQADLATALKINAHTAGRRLRGDVDFDVTELLKVAAWLGVPVEQFLPEQVAS